MRSPYRELANALAPDGIVCRFQSEGQLVVSRQSGPVWPNAGNSFWVTHESGTWYLFTWSPVGYRVPATAEMAALCRKCMDIGGAAMGVVPKQIIGEFDLQELSDEEADLILGAD